MTSRTGRSSSSLVIKARTPNQRATSSRCGNARAAPPWSSIRPSWWRERAQSLPIAVHAGFMNEIDSATEGFRAALPGFAWKGSCYHIYHGDVQPPREGPRRVYEQLWIEGLATLASKRIVAGATERQIMPMSHLHDPSRPSRDIQLAAL